MNHYTRYSWLYPLKRKSEVKEIFQTFKPLVEGEYNALKEYLSQHGNSHMTTLPHRPEHNCLSERKHRHIVETGLPLLSTAYVPKSYWTYAFQTAVYLINLMPTPTLSHQSPYQKLFGVPPNYEKSKVFGCLCFPWLRPYNNHKLDDRSTECVFIGYSTSQTVYLCLHRPSCRFFTSRQVHFVEERFPFATQTTSSSDNPTPTQQQSSHSQAPSVVPIQFMSTATPGNPPSSILQQQPSSPPLPPTTTFQICSSNPS